MEEFLIPVQHTGLRYYRVQAQNLEEAIEQVGQKADVFSKYELRLSDSSYRVLAPSLMLTEEERETWPCWEYGYTGSDGVDWRVNYTRDGLASVPDYAEEVHPVPKNWLESWREEPNS